MFPSRAGAVVDGRDGVGLDELDELDELGQRIVSGVAELSSFMARWLALVTEFDRREGWAADGARSMAQWLSWKCGIDARTARAHVRVAAQLVGLPVLRSAFAEGRLSYSKVRAVCRVANEHNEALLLELASSLTATQLDRAVSRYEVAHSTPFTSASDEERRAECGVRTWTDERGLHHTEIVSSPEDGAVIAAAIDCGRDQRYRSSKTVEPGGAGRLDALVWVLRRGLVNAERPDLDDDSPYAIVIHVKEASALLSDDGHVELEDGTRLHPRTLRRLGCDSVLQAMVIGVDGRPLDLGRRSRTANRKQRRALRAMYSTCQFPGCDVDVRFCEFHHLDEWGAGGRSDLHVFRPLCRRHHHQVHEGGWRLVVDVLGGIAALPPSCGDEPRRKVVVNAPPLTEAPVAASSLVASNRAAGLTPEDEALDWLAGRWGGERLDRWALGAIVDNLFAADLTPPSLN